MGMVRGDLQVESTKEWTAMPGGVPSQISTRIQMQKSPADRAFVTIRNLCRFWLR